MNLVVLHHSEALTLASTQGVIAADKLGTLKSMLEQAEDLSSHLSAEKTRLDAAESQARQKGQAAGFIAGRQQGLEAASADIAAQRAMLADCRLQLQQEATMMAFEIVRQLADTLDTAELLCALAITAARACPANEQLVLRVHANYREAVAGKLVNASADINARITQVVGDAGVDTRACIVESRASRVLADLETQIKLLEDKLSDG